MDLAIIHLSDLTGQMTVPYCHDCGPGPTPRTMTMRLLH